MTALLRPTARLLLLSGLMICAGLCHAADKAPAPPPTEAKAADGELLQIQEGTQGFTGNLTIGVLGVKKSNYVDAKGVKRRGLVCALQLHLEDAAVKEDDPSKNWLVAVHEGQVIEMGGYRIAVQRIWNGETGGIAIRVRAPIKPFHPH